MEVPLKSTMDDYDSDQVPDLVYSSDTDDDQQDDQCDWLPTVKIRTLAPFLFNHRFGMEQWLKLLQESGLLSSKWLADKPEGIPGLLKTVELMEHFIACITAMLRSRSHRDLACNLIKSLNVLILTRKILPIASEHKLLYKVRHNLKKLPPDEDKDKVTVGLLYACYQYVEVLKDVNDSIRMYARLVERSDKEAEATIKRSASKFEDGHYDEVINLTSEAIKTSHFSYELYAQRSEAYILVPRCEWLALLDAKRSILLNEKYAKGHYLYVSSCIKLNKKEQAAEHMEYVRSLNLYGTKEDTKWMRKVIGMCDAFLWNASLDMQSPAQKSPAAQSIPNIKKMQSSPVNNHHSKVFTCKQRRGRMEDKRKVDLKAPNKYSVSSFKDRHTKGSTFFLNGDYDRAIEFYKQAEEDRPSNPTGQHEDNVGALVIYCLCAALRKRATKKDLKEAIIKLSELLENVLVGPVSHLALGEAYYLQAQFNKSEEILQQGLTKWQLQKMITWPGTDRIIEESDSSKLKEALNDMIISCHSPPPPVAVCRFPKGKDHLNINIYTEDPNFKGYVRIVCHDKCIIEYHTECWKKIINEVNKPHKKDLANTECLTPDCNALIKSVTFYDSDGVEKRKGGKGNETNKSQTSTKKKKPKRVPRSQRQSKCKRNLELWEERKLMKKERRQQIREEKQKKLEVEKQSDNIDIDQAADGATGASKDQDVLPISGSVECAIVLKKEKSPSSNKQVVQKKKKEKPRKNMTLSEFVGNHPEDYEEENDFDMVLDDIERITYMPQVNAWRSPNDTSYLGLSNPDNHIDGRSQLFGGASNKQVAEVTSSAETNDVVSQQTGRQSTDEKDFLYSFFYNTLKHHGPLKVDDEIIMQNLQNFPEELLAIIDAAGGIGPFLDQNVTFGCLNDLVFLIHDRPKAVALSQNQKKSLLEKYCLDVEQTSLKGSRRNRKKKKKKKNPQGVAALQCYDFVDDECLSESSWPESDVSSQFKLRIQEDWEQLPGITNNNHIGFNDQVQQNPNGTFPNLITYCNVYPNACNKVCEQGIIQTASPSDNLNLSNSKHEEGTDWQINLSAGLETAGKASSTATQMSPPSHDIILKSRLQQSTVSDTMSSVMCDLNSDADDSHSVSYSDLSTMSNKHLDQFGEVSLLATNIDIQDIPDIQHDAARGHFEKPVITAPVHPSSHKKRSRIKTKNSVTKSTVDTEAIRNKLLKLNEKKKGEEWFMQLSKAKSKMDDNHTSDASISGDHKSTTSDVAPLNDADFKTENGSSGKDETTHDQQAADCASQSSSHRVKSDISKTESKSSANSIDAGVNTEITGSYWVEMEIVNKQLKDENLRLKERLRNEEQTRNALVEEHSEQVEQLIEQLRKQDSANEELKRQLDEERKKHGAEVQQLMTEIEALQTIGERNKAVYGLTKTPNNIVVEPQKKVESFDETVLVLSSLYPSYSITEIRQHLSAFMKAKGRTLTGMKLCDIVQQVAHQMMTKDTLDDTDTSAMPEPTETYQEELNPCVICYEELTPDTQTTADCGHTFHLNCIRKWLQKNRSCPTCRTHFLMYDEYPALH